MSYSVTRSSSNLFHVTRQVFEKGTRKRKKETLVIYSSFLFAMTTFLPAAQRERSNVTRRRRACFVVQHDYQLTRPFVAINFQLQRLRSMHATLANWSLRIKRLVPYDANAFASVLVTSVDVIVNQPCHFLFFSFLFFLSTDSADTRDIA